MSRSGETLLLDFVNWTSFTGLTPLMLACRNGHKECMALLMSSGRGCGVCASSQVPALPLPPPSRAWRSVGASTTVHDAVCGMGYV